MLREASSTVPERLIPFGVMKGFVQKLCGVLRGTSEWDRCPGVSWNVFTDAAGIRGNHRDPETEAFEQ